MSFGALLMNRVFLVGGAPPPFRKARAESGAFSASDLAVACARPLLARQLFPASALDEVIVGCVIPAADEANIARLIALRLGCGKRVPAHSRQRNCASGLQAIASAAERVQLGRAHLVLAGGAEAMSRAPIQWNNVMASWRGQMLRSGHPLRRVRTLARFRPSLLKPGFTLLLGLTAPPVEVQM